jgi:hypothetical protein
MVYMALTYEQARLLGAGEVVVKRKHKPNLSQEWMDRVVLKQVRQVDRLMKEHRANPPTLVKLIQAKATLYSLIHPKPGVAKRTRSRPVLQPPSPAPVLDGKPSANPTTPTPVPVKDVVPGTNSVPGTSPTTSNQG